MVMKEVLVGYFVLFTYFILPLIRSLLQNQKNTIKSSIPIRPPWTVQILCNLKHRNWDGINVVPIYGQKYFVIYRLVFWNMDLLSCIKRPSREQKRERERKEMRSQTFCKAVQNTSDSLKTWGKVFLCR